MFLRCAIFLLYSVFLVLPASAQKNMNEARPEIRQLLNEQTAKYWSDAQVDSAWNRAQAEIALFSGIMVQRFATIRTPFDSSVAGGSGGGLVQRKYYYKFGVAPIRLRSVFCDSGTRSPLFLTIMDDPRQIPYLSAQTKPTYCYLHDTVLVFYPAASDTERYQITYFSRPANLASAATATDLPFFIQPAAVWLAASFLMNQDYKYDVSDRYYKRALDLVMAYKSAFQMQTEPIPGMAPTNK